MKKDMTFCRGLNDEAQNSINKFFSNLPMIREAVDDMTKTPTFQICIRENYINVYWKGCSVLAYYPLKNKYLIHYKYISGKKAYFSAKEKKNNYIELELTQDREDLAYNKGQWSFRKNIIASSEHEKDKNFKEYISYEKEAITEYIEREKPFLLDLEIAFTSENDKGKYSAKRIDMARLKKIDGKLFLQFVEVKIDKDPRLRSNTVPKIMVQMEDYKDFLKNMKGEIIKSYKRIAQNYLNLSLTDSVCHREKNEVVKLLEEFVKEGVVDSKPYLLIIGKREKMNARKPNKNHLDRLKDLFANKKYPEPELFSWPTLD